MSASLRLSRAFARAPLTAKVGASVICLYIIVAFLAPLLAPFSESEIVGTPFEPWGATHLLGTDSLGRDMLSRIMFGARNTIGIAFAATLIAFSVGAALGLYSAALGGWADEILSRIVDAIMSVPILVSALLLLTIFGTNLMTLILVIALLDSTRVFRLARSVGMSLMALDFIEVAKLRGERTIWIVLRELLPNTVVPLTAEFGLRFCFVFLTIAALSFLGLGIQPPHADWGSMVRESAALISFGDVTPLIPAFAITLLTVSINFVVDWFLAKSGQAAP